MCAEGHRPICQDTGIVNVFIKVGMDVRFDFNSSFEDAINEGVRRAYLDPDNKLRASVLDESDFGRKNTKDNTPAVINVQLVAGDKVEIDVAAKGGGSEAKAKFAMLNPSDSIAEWVLKTVPTMGAGWCPPGMLGIGIGGTAEKAMLLAKESLMEPIDMAELKTRGAKSNVDKLRVELYDKVNALGIGAQGLGGPCARGQSAGGDDSQLRRDAACALRPRRLGAGGIRGAEAFGLARGNVETRFEFKKSFAGYFDSRGSRVMEAGAAAAAIRKAAHRPRCSA